MVTKRIKLTKKAPEWLKEEIAEEKRVKRAKKIKAIKINDKITEIKKLRKQGLSWQAIAKKLKVRKANILAFAKKYGIPTGAIKKKKVKKEWRPKEGWIWMEDKDMIDLGDYKYRYSWRYQVYCKATFISEKDIKAAKEQSEGYSKSFILKEQIEDAKSEALNHARLFTSFGTNAEMVKVDFKLIRWRYLKRAE